nr:hypothetical protein [Tanacetum cinerariifolium]
RALSLIRADLISSPKRIRDSSYLTDLEFECRETSLRGDVIVRGSDEPHLEHDIDPEDTPEPTQEERAVECTYEILGSLVQRFHDHAVAIPVHRVQVIEGVQMEQGRRIIGVESAVIALTKRITELERDNKRLRGTR